MTKRVHVIASFNVDGQVRPLWVRLSLAEDAPTYKVIDCKCTAVPGMYVDYTPFRCSVSTPGGARYEVGLNYYARECRWYITINNSSPLATATA